MLEELIYGYINIIIYFIISASTALLFKKFLVVEKEVFRKVLHFILLGSIVILVYGFETWWISVIATGLLIVMVYPLLTIGEKIKGYSDMLVERKNGEIKRSFVIVFIMFIAIITLCWGIIGEKYLVLASIFAWGFGDAAAALVGVKFGNKYFKGNIINKNKSVEGSLAMFFVSFVAVIGILLLNNPNDIHKHIPIAIITAAVASFVELISKDGMDTITCPLASAMVLIPMIHLMGGF